MKVNTRNPAVKRIMQEIRELQRENSSEMAARALEDNIFEWHFAIRGPPDTEFEGGFYHGRIIMPHDYPYKPPAFMLLTPNGRFETGTKICLSISAHHPEHWQPSWSVRTALIALIAFMPTPANGALGSLTHSSASTTRSEYLPARGPHALHSDDFPKEERRRLAAKSRTEPPKYGNTARQQVTEEVHQQMLDLEAASKPKAAGCRLGSSSSGELSSARDAQQTQVPSQISPSTPELSSVQPVAAERAPSTEEPFERETSWEDRWLNILAAAISLAIMAILGRKALSFWGFDSSRSFGESPYQEEQLL